MNRIKSFFATLFYYPKYAYAALTKSWKLAAVEKNGKAFVNRSKAVSQEILEARDYRRQNRIEQLAEIAKHPVDMSISDAECTVSCLEKK
jgi:hypothetical protein